MPQRAAQPGTGPGGTGNREAGAGCAVFRTLRKTLFGKDKATPRNLNEAVNFEAGLIFIAVPKTGSTTVRRQVGSAGPHLIPNPHLDIQQIRDLLYTWLLRQELGTNDRFPGSAVRTDTDLRDDAARWFEGLFKFSMVRNPWARAVSLYHRKEGVRVGERMDFRSFVKNHFHASDTCRHPTLHGNQVDWLTDADGRIAVDHVAKLEDLNAEVATLAEKSNGRVHLAARTMNRNEASPSTAYRDLYDDHTRHLIATRFEKDIDLFGYTF